MFIAKATQNLSWVSNFYSNYADFKSVTILTPYKWLAGIVVGLITKLISILGITVTNKTLESVFNYLVIVSGALSVLVIYYLVLKATKSRLASTLGAMFVAFSGIQLIWSGFIITDTFACLMLLLAIYLRLYKNNVVVNIIMYVLLYLTRPEFLIIGVVLETCLLAIRLLTKKNLSAIFLKANAFILLGLFIFTTFNSELITRNFTADIALWICLIASILLFLFVPNKYLKLNQSEFKLINVVMFVAEALLAIYFWFNPEISRYIVTLIPIFAIIASIGIYKYFVIAKVTNLKYIGFTIICITLVYNVYYFATFNKLEAPEYHTEEATIVLNYAKQNGIKTIYVGQEEAYLWLDTNKEFNIIPLDNLNVKNIPINSLLIMDASIPYINANFETANLNQLGFTQKKEFTTLAPFRINNDVSSGLVEIWEK